MNTLLLKNNEHDIKLSAEILRTGGLVAIPTETVYGLAANALDGKAVEKIFKAKNRPMDNPLIVHIADIADIERFSLVSQFTENAKKLALAFWPGPLTIILKKGSSIPDEVSGGLDTVAIRFPSHKTAQAIIKEANIPLAAPSANLSGSPSPTSAQHVFDDLNGRIDAIVDGGECLVGVESTVITLAGDKPRLLRPGGITHEMLCKVLGEVEIDDAVLHKLAQGQRVLSPGMKYKHYAPKANVILLKGENDEFIKYVNKKSDNETAAICFEEDEKSLCCKTVIIGKSTDYETQAHRLFDCLRLIDKNKEIKTVYAHCPKTDGVGLALYNRLIRAAGFEVIDLEKI